jgi:phthalate 4,5-dioxygenase oxygenase subunit
VRNIRNDYMLDREKQKTESFTGIMGVSEQDAAIQDSQGPVQDRTREHLGTSDKVIMANRRTLLKAIETVRAGGKPPLAIDAQAAAALTGPDTIDCIAPADRWSEFWSEAAAAKRSGAAWLRAGAVDADRASAGAAP